MSNESNNDNNIQRAGNRAFYSPFAIPGGIGTGVGAAALFAHQGMGSLVLAGIAGGLSFAFQDDLRGIATDLKHFVQRQQGKNTHVPAISQEAIERELQRIRQQEQSVGEDNDDFSLLPAQSGPFTLSQLLATGWRPSANKIFLARLEDGTDIFVRLDQIVHVALAGATRQGKTSIIRQLLSQLCYIGCYCILLDPHYTPYDITNGEDWTPFERHLKVPPLEYKSYDKIEQFLKHMATTMLAKRESLRSQSKPLGKDIFVVVDEYPELIAERPVIQKHVSKLLRSSGKYNIHLIVASQDFQVKTAFPDVGGAVRSAFSTVGYVGGDKVAVREMLQTDIDPDTEASLGKGPIYIRCETCKKASPARTPLADNKAVCALLGPSTYVPSEEESVEEELIEPITEDLNSYPDEPAQQVVPSTPPVTATVTPVIPDKGPKAEDIDLAVAIAVWNIGYNSERKLMKAFPGLTLYQSGKLAEMIKEQAKEASE